MDDVSKGVNKTVGEVLRNIAESFARVMKVVWVISTTVANFFVAKLNFIIWFVSKFIYVVLFAALLFTTRFLVQGIQHPDKLDYAVGMSGLIVAAVTVFSILVAYYEFASKRKK
ncbi:hypothetical protein X559_0954 [Paenilisteria newyorkensis]|nr:hypothetical protein X559_0954 [Listeria newyorkensis]